jgi:formylglycine-generating enzyme required for sulfatase activity
MGETIKRLMLVRLLMYETKVISGEMNDQQRRRLKQGLEALEHQHSLWSEKLSRLSEARAIETDAATIFKLDNQISEAEEEIEILKPKIELLEEQLRSNYSHPTPPVLPVTPPILPPIDRRKFIKWAGFGGTGAILVFALPKIFDWITRILFPIPTIPFSFSSAKLNDKGDIIPQPKGQAQIYKEDLGNGISLTMVKIPADEFLMGSPPTEEGREDNESTPHLVKVPEFYIGQTLVTQEQWKQIMGKNPSQSNIGGKFPVEWVDCLESQKFCQELSQQTHRKYRLPSESEWEYACRAGTTTPFYFGNTISLEVANYRAQDWDYNGKNHPGKYGEGKLGKSRQQTTLVNTFPPNGFGLYDMHGNLWEWCLNENKEAEGILRGGSWFRPPGYCRSATRYHKSLNTQDRAIGFRVVCEV